jgi:hypothetical protein
MTARTRTGLAVLALALTWLTGCASKEMVVDLYGSVVYEKPEILEVSHTVNDERRQGGEALVEVVVLGDPGLAASFDIYPGIVERHPMEEAEDGRYLGRFLFPSDHVGGSFTITGRLEHTEAGEVVLRDPEPLSISRVEGRR